MDWPKKPTKWIEGRNLFVSIPFTWNLLDVKNELRQTDFEWDMATVGGPAVRLMPKYFDSVPGVFATTVDLPGVLQKVNPHATKTSVGCTNKCGFCAVPQIEPNFSELKDWPDRHIICDNNLLACSEKHFDKVLDRLEYHYRPDFNQGLDLRLITDHHIERIKKLKIPIVRFSCDTNKELEFWRDKIKYCISNGIKKSWISTYALIGWNDTPKEAWERCNAIEKSVRRINPQWFHDLDAMEFNKVTNKQIANG